MSWAWSHSAEAQADLLRQLCVQSLDWLIEVWAEWKANSSGYFHPHHPSALFDEARFERALRRGNQRFRCEHPQRQAQLREALAHRIHALAERLSLCDNGGFRAHCCPQGCHLLPWAEGDGSDALVVPPQAEGELCDECGACIPDVEGGGLANRHHKDSCSLYEAAAP